MAEGNKLWGGRFSEQTDAELEKLNASIGYDQRMWREDIQGSKAYAKGLLKINLLTKDEENQINTGLEKISNEWHSNTFKLKPSDEDIHTACERRLAELTDPVVAGKLHTGRSRNDQVATDMRLWMKPRIQELHQHICAIIQEICLRAENEIDILMPGYTHLQRAQPVRWSHWLLSHAWNLRADITRLEELLKRVDEMPLGSGAIAGHPFGIDREQLANDLGFKNISQNSMHAVGDRDFVTEFLFWSSLNTLHLSRFAEDIIIFSTQEFGFIRLADSFSTGSSLMPQKRNPDSLELIRGKAGRIFGKCVGFMMTLKNLPSTYNKDIQEDKEAMFESYDNLLSVLKVFRGVIKTLQVDKNKCMDSLSIEMLATDIAYYLVRKGISFREAHRLAGEVVAKSESCKKKISELNLKDFKSVSEDFKEDIFKVWNFESSVEQYSAIGGTAKSCVLEQINILLNYLKPTLE